MMSLFFRSPVISSHVNQLFAPGAKLMRSVKGPAIVLKDEAFGFFGTTRSCHLACPFPCANACRSLGGGKAEKPDALVLQVLAKLDWEPALRNGNSWYDRLVAVLRLKDRA